MTKINLTNQKNLLTKGITGFNSEQYIPETEIRRFLKDIQFPYCPIHDKIAPPSLSTNFWRVPIKNQIVHIRFDLLINSVAWYFALVDSKSTWMNHDYLPFPTLLLKQIKTFRKDLYPLSPEVLNKTINKKDLANLDKEEIRQIEYWDSKTLGDVLFNGYD